MDKPESRTQELELFLRSKKISARELARRAGLSPAAVCKIRARDHHYVVEEVDSKTVRLWIKNPLWTPVKARA